MSQAVHVDIWRPERTFGIAVRVWRDNWSGVREVLVFAEEGREQWVSVAKVSDPEGHAVPAPVTMQMDDSILRELHRGLDQYLEPPETADEALIGAYEDRIERESGLADRLMTLVEGITL